MAPQEIAGKQHAVLPKICHHGIRPVQQRGHHKFQGQAADVQRIPVLDHPAGEIPVGDALQVFLSGGGTYHRAVGAQLQQFLKAAGMVRLCMVHDNIVNAGQIHQALEVIQIFFKEIRMHRFHQYLLLPSDKVRVIGSAVFGLHDNIKYTQGRVEYPHRIYVIRNLDNTHVFSSLSKKID